MGFYYNNVRDNLCYVFVVGEEGWYNGGKLDRLFCGGILY